MKKKGFTLLEVIIAIMIFSIFSVSVFYFFSNAIERNLKFEEKYVILRMAKEFISQYDTLQQDGTRTREGFLLKWHSTPMEEPRKIVTGSDVNYNLQLKLVHLDIIRQEDQKNLLSVNFIYNDLLSAKK
jgi:prepilin-type N-terminal cleavage/methylation domain-containing protein